MREETTTMGVPQHPQPEYGRCAAAARWLLLGAVITGVLAMHVLSGADSAGSHQPMAMTTAAVAAPATGMNMSMPDAGSASAAFRVTGTHVVSSSGVAMSPMSCCVLFLVSTALVLLMRGDTAAVNSATDAPHGQAPLSAPTQRGPPGPRPPRIALSVLRV